ALEREEMVRVGDPRNGETEDVTDGRVERDVVRAHRRVLALHHEPEEMLPDRLVADGVLELLAQREHRKLEGVHVAVLGDGEPLRCAELAYPAQVCARPERRL